MPGSRFVSEIKKAALDRNVQVLLANILWVVLAAAAVSIFVLGSIGLLNGLREPCVVFQNQAREFCLERQESLAELGIALSGYAAFSTVTLIVKVLPWILVGVLIYSRKSNELPGTLFSLALILIGTIAIDASLAAWVVFYYPWLAPVVTILEFCGLASVTLLYAFPDGQFVPRWTRWLALLWVLGAFGSVFLGGTLFDITALPAPLSSVPAVLVASFFYSLGYRYFQTANALQKRQIWWLAVGAVIYGVVYLLRLFPAMQSGPTITPLPLIYSVVLAVSSGLFALCLGAAILRPRLFERSGTVQRNKEENVREVAAVMVEQNEGREMTGETKRRRTTDHRRRKKRLKGGRR